MRVKRVLDGTPYYAAFRSPFSRLHDFVPKESAKSLLKGNDAYDVFIHEPLDAAAPSFDSDAFAEIFPRVLRSLIAEQSCLLLHVRSGVRHGLDELELVRDVLVPRNLHYVLLDSSGDRSQVAEAGRLIFEWPRSSFDEIAERWLGLTAISLEGFVVESWREIGAFTDLYYRLRNPEFTIELLRGIDFGFALWTDLDGLTVFADSNRDIGSRLGSSVSVVGS